MTFQVHIDLEISDRDVQAVIDFDTGFLGFLEIREDKVIESHYQESPAAFRTALLEALGPVLGTQGSFNFKISKKNEHMLYINAYLRKHT